MIKRMKGDKSDGDKEVFQDKDSYLLTLRDRKKVSKIYQKHQLIGLEIATMLDDLGHRSFYMKLAREKNADAVLGLAKDVASRSQIRNKGAYFMKIIHNKKSNFYK